MTLLTSKTDPLRCLTGALIAGTLGILLYRLTGAIAYLLATHAVSPHNQLVYSLAVAVRTLVVGLCTLATGVFSIIALGLVALTLQLLWERWIQREQA
ncbi:hypothetical protein NK55_05885 [Thermosynechococcus sp. NK55a]|jgi:site-specific recombinase|uniref:DUF3082 domain-containing protein n=1 Tax=unclassified Thermosynechococcus TaxID=2622553 RepID=UPI0003D85BAD|nr:MULTISPECIES: DUF3082 domain-containing protein [unclassified Thermosynechococcus]AHB88484.1 hypothetical protein NK55_05885 [Thermosynechococcus sp. NK55a]RMH65033.1 MAG: DUF3082 domain-containing protein [Cyanobacteria bacterium J003]HIK22825.1 DUF3082 domain-containing protein [Thermosynechococcus sp. M3746_W2019_013]